MTPSDHEGDGGWPTPWDKFTPDRRTMKVAVRDQNVFSNGRTDADAVCQRSSDGKHRRDEKGVCFYCGDQR